MDDVRGLRAVPAAPVLDVVAAVEGHRFSRFAVEHAVGALLGRPARRDLPAADRGGPRARASRT